MPLEVPLDVFEGTRVVDVDLGGVFCVICGPRFGTTERVVARVVIVDLDSTAKKMYGVCDTLFREYISFPSRKQAFLEKQFKRGMSCYQTISRLTRGV